MAEPSSRYWEYLQEIVNDVEMDFLVDDSGRTFLDFYQDWKQERFYHPIPRSGNICHSCRGRIKGESLEVIRTEEGGLGKPSRTTHYFHERCFDRLVMRNHTKGSIKVIDGG